MDKRMLPMNSDQTARVLHEVAERSAKLLGEYAKKDIGSSVAAAAGDELGIAKAYMDLYARMLANPAGLAAFSTNLMLDYMQLWQSSWMKMLGVQSVPVAAPAKGDGRFKDDDWSSNFLFDYMKQSYLIASRHIQHAVANVEGLSPESEKKVAFFTRQYVDALSPSNFALTNPQVLRETLASGGQNLLKGLNNLNQHDRREGLQARPERRHHAGQGRPPDRAHAADPVRADHEGSLQDAAGDHSAVDQQVLHPRPASLQLLHQVGARPGAYGVRPFLGESGRAPRADGLRGLHEAGSARGAGRGGAGHRRAPGEFHRLLPGRHAAWGDVGLLVPEKPD